jgi:hypothetical protein
MGLCLDRCTHLAHRDGIMALIFDALAGWLVRIFLAGLEKEMGVFMLPRFILSSREGLDVDAYRDSMSRLWLRSYQPLVW